MSKWLTFGYSLLIVGILSGCNQTTALDKQITNNSPNLIEKPEGDNWKKISLPIYGESLTDYKDSFLVIGRGAVKIESNLEAQEVKFPAVVTELISQDGGLTVKPLEKNNSESLKYPNSLCSAEKAVVAGNKLYAIGPCEHTSQFWKFDFDKSNEKSLVINFTYHTHPKADPDDMVYGPTDIDKSGERVLLAANLKQGPAILEAIENKPELQKIWQGESTEGLILTINFVGKSGWAATSKGKILYSSDEGRTWNYLSEAPSKIAANIFDVKFRDNLEGYIVGDKGMIFHTTDGGKTWEEQDSGVSSTLHKISLNNEIAVATSLDGNLLMNVKGESAWKKLDFKGNNKISDVLIRKNNLFVLSGEDLYFSDYKQ